MFNVTQELINRQLEREEQQITGGVDRYKKNLQRLQQKGDYGVSLPGHWFIETFFPALVAKFEEEIDNALSGKPGRRMAAMKFLTLLSGETLTYLTLRITIDSIMQNKNEKTRIAQRIGAAVQEELHHLAMREDKKRTKAYKYWTERAEKASHNYTKTRCLEKLKSLYDPEIFINIDVKDRTDMGVTCLEFVRQAFPEAIVETSETVQGNDFPSYFIGLSDHVNNQISEINTKLESLWPINDPMLVPPKAWTGAFAGGFIGSVGKRTKLIRTTKRRYLEDLDLNRDRLTPVFDALNAIQATPWRINIRIYEAMTIARNAAWRTRYGLPAEDNKKLPPQLPKHLAEDKQALQAWALECQEVLDFNKTAEGNRKSMEYTLATAKKCVGEVAIYFPHNLDWRGRIYPMSSHLSPQGADLSRSLLEFARGMPLKTPQAVGYLAVHGANCYGYDKVSFDERIAWVKENESNIRESAADPLTFDWWAKADSPWTFLAWCLDWVGYLENGLEHVSHLPVAMDGSCNGLQNFAAMLRHPGTAKAVNLAPADRPNDIYTQVGNIVAARVKALADSREETADELYEIVKERTNREINEGKKGDETKKETGELWNSLAAKWINGQITRTLVKRPVMTYPYAASVFGMKEQLAKTLRELYREGKIDIPYHHASKIAFMLKEIVYQTVRQEVKAAAEAMDWLKHVATVVSLYNLPVAWVSPVGLPVLQEYKVKQGKQLKTTVGKQRINQYIMEETDLIDPRSQASAIALNFVHSCDASHLMLTVNACQERGINDFHMIHDSYGTHATNAPLLARTLREQFIGIYSGNVLEDFRKYVLLSLLEEAADEVKKTPQQGDFNLSLVLKSKYFFV